MHGRTVRTFERGERLLAKLARGYSILAACKAEGIGRRTFYDWLAADPAFAKAYADALDDGTDVIEDVARSKALAGDNTMIALMLKARRPEKYRDPTDTAGPSSGPVVLHTRWVEVRTDLLAVLAAHPDALAEVAGHLDELAAGDGPGSSE